MPPVAPPSAKSDVSSGGGGGSRAGPFFRPMAAHPPRVWGWGFRPAASWGGGSQQPLILSIFLFRPPHEGTTPSPPSELLPIAHSSHPRGPGSGPGVAAQCILRRRTPRCLPRRLRRKCRPRPGPTARCTHNYQCTAQVTPCPLGP